MSTAGGFLTKELSELLARDLLIPVVHETTYDELRKVSPLLASRNGLNTADDSIADVVTKIAELVAVEDNLAASLSGAAGAFDATVRERIMPGGGAG